MPGRRAALLGSAIETLETRGLLSVVAPVGAAHSEVADGYRGVVEVAAHPAERQGGRISSSETAESRPDDLARTARPDGGSALAPSPAVRDNSDAASANKRPTSRDVATRELTDPLLVESRSSDPSAITAPTDEPPATEPGTMSGFAGDAALDPAGAASVLGWASGVVMPVIVSLANSPGRVVGVDGRPVAGRGASEVAAAPAGPVAVVAEREIPAPAPADMQTATTWGGLLEEALHPDWEAVDGELRQFLSRLDVLADAPDGRGGWPSWPLWMGVATAVLVARRASRGSRRLFRRPAPGSVWLLDGHPVPVGPWPMGSP